MMLVCLHVNAPFYHSVKRLISSINPRMWNVLMKSILVWKCANIWKLILLVLKDQTWEMFKNFIMDNLLLITVLNLEKVMSKVMSKKFPMNLTILSENQQWAPPKSILASPTYILTVQTNWIPMWNAALYLILICISETYELSIHEIRYWLT